MIKRITFLRRLPDVEVDRFATSLPDAMAVLAGAARDVQPRRTTVATPVLGLGDAHPRHDAVVLEWFDDAVHLARWASSSEAPEVVASDASLARLTPPASAIVVVADEVVVRGADWLAGRWVDGGPKLKHVALARRAEGLTPAEFSQSWRDHAGRVGGGADAAPATVIPDDVRGLAYVQNHPGVRARRVDWAYDAINEVYFDDVESLERRVHWFRDNRVGAQPDGLTGASWFLALREVVVPPSP